MKRTKRVVVRVNEDEDKVISQLAGAYDLDVSELMRRAVMYIEDNRPLLKIIPKVVAPSEMMARM